MAKSKPAPLAAGTIVGAYRIEQMLAAGGFGVVYRARDGSGREVAIKEYLPTGLVERELPQRCPRVLAGKQSLYQLGLRSFFEEGRALAQIAHPAVVAVLDFFLDNDTVYLVMEYLHGASLQDYILAARARQRRRVLREATIRSLFDELLRGLRIVHQHGLLHLDIKPANILITDDNRAVLIDFGAAREALALEQGGTRPMFTPGFAAPELQRHGQLGELGPWTDLYAVGATMLACMLGHPPFDARQRLERDRVEESLSSLRGRYSAALLQVVRWCLALDPSARPASVFALQQALTHRAAPCDNVHHG
jgi:serine/threonine protein kinase